MFIAISLVLMAYFSISVIALGFLQRGVERAYLDGGVDPGWRDRIEMCRALRKRGREALAAEFSAEELIRLRELEYAFFERTWCWLTCRFATATMVFALIAEVFGNYSLDG